MSVSDAYNFKKAIGQIDTSGVVGESQLACLKQEGYCAVVNLLPDESEYAVSKESEIVKSQGISYYYIPVNFSAPTSSDFIEFEHAMSVLPNGKALLHCAANYRVSAFFSIYAFRSLGWSPEEARNFIASIWDTSEHPVWEEFVSERLRADNS